MMMTESVEVYKTAHLLLAKHGPKIVEDIESKIAVYGKAADREAVTILEQIRNAASMLMAYTPENGLPN